jgi:hypothetical protein
MGDDEAALLRLWREKRGDVEPEDLSGNLIVQLALATDELNRRWYETNTGQVLTDVQRQIRHPALRWMVATLDGRVEATGAVFESKFMLPKPGSFATFTAIRRASSRVSSLAADLARRQRLHGCWLQNFTLKVDAEGGGATGDVGPRGWRP